MSILPKTLAAGLSAAALFATTACGSTAPSQAEAAEQDRAERSGGPISVTDATGETLELPGPAVDVATLEWQQTEMVLSLGVTPVAVADPAGFRTWDTAEDLPDDVANVGMRNQVSPGKLFGAFETEPDLIIATETDPILERLEQDYPQIPVLVTGGADGKDPIGAMRETFELIATTLGKEDVAADVLDEFDQSLAEAEAAVKEASPEVTDFVYVDGYVSGSTLSIRPFGQGSLVGELGEEIGLTNAWTGKVDPVYGLGATDVEGLTAVQDAYLLYTGTEQSSWFDPLESNPLWTNSDFVRNDRVRPFDEGIWTFGGPRSAEQILDGYVAAVS